MQNKGGSPPHCHLIIDQSPTVRLGYTHVIACGLRSSSAMGGLSSGPLFWDDRSTSLAAIQSRVFLKFRCLGAGGPTI